jgi:hypothetical protein
MVQRAAGTVLSDDVEHDRDIVGFPPPSFPVEYRKHSFAAIGLLFTIFMLLLLVGLSLQSQKRLYCIMDLEALPHVYNSHAVYSTASLKISTVLGAPNSDHDTIHYSLAHKIITTLVSLCKTPSPSIYSHDPFLSPGSGVGVDCHTF